MGRFIRFYPGALLIFLWNGFASLSAQNVLTDMDHDAHHEYDRMIILSGGGDSSIHSALKPFWRHDLVALADSFSIYALHKVEQYQVQSIWDQNNEFVIPSEIDSTISSSIRYRVSKRPLWNTFYKTPAHFYEVDVKDFYLRVNPLIRFAVGQETEEGVTTFINQRGLSLRGGVGKNVFFQTSIYDSQVRFPNYINQYTDTFGVVPGAGLFKDFDSALFNTEGGKDYLLANAYVGINLGKYIGFQLGHNQYFIGEGIRSLLLSDFSTPYFSLKINTRIWKIHYQNIFAELSADNFMSAQGTSIPIPKKYMAAHYLSFKPNYHFSIGLFETVIFNRPEHQFELQYLNPVILYRTIEGWIGSPDNVILGLNSRMDIGRSVSLYGQLVLDDILIGSILDGQLDWWGNKYGFQLGVKYLNVLGIKFLDSQVEWNRVRPYTYSHYDEHANYSNYKQPLAHPMGANFNEWIVSLRYQASERLRFRSTIYLTYSGEDVDTISYGYNVIVPNTKRPGDYGHFVGRGIETDLVYWSTGIQYELSPGVFWDVDFVFRKKTSTLPERNLKTNLFQVGFRYNMVRLEEVF